MVDFGSAFFGGFFLFFMLFFILILLSIVFWIVMLIDAIKREFKNEDDKTLWIVIIIFGSVVGAIAYYFLIKLKNKK